MTVVRIVFGVVTGVVGLWILSLAVGLYGMFIMPGHLDWPSPYVPWVIAATLVLGAGAAKTAVMALSNEPIRSWVQRLSVAIGLVAVAFAGWMLVGLMG